VTGSVVADGVAGRRPPPRAEHAGTVVGDVADFCRAEHPRLVGLLALYVGDRSVAEELAQDTLLQVCTQWPRVREMRAPSAWASRVALNLASSWWRRRSAERRAAARSGPTPDVVAADEGHTGDSVEVARIRAAVAALPEQQRRAIVLRFFADLDTAEVAEAMGCDAGTVRSYVARGLARLRTVDGLQQLELDEGDRP
jgi:RNA polymerase sigma-70 factor (sigma-E family)